MVTVIPKDVSLAAKRGFVRTTFQAYATAIPAGGVSAAALISLAVEPNWAVVSLTAAAWLLSPLLAGLASYLSITARGVPEEYAEAATLAP